MKRPEKEHLDRPAIVGDEITMKGFGPLVGVVRTGSGWAYDLFLVRFRGQVLHCMMQDSDASGEMISFYLRGQCVAILDDERIVMKSGGQLVLVSQDDVQVLDPFYGHSMGGSDDRLPGEDD